MLVCGSFSDGICMALVYFEHGLSFGTIFVLDMCIFSSSDLIVIFTPWSQSLQSSEITLKLKRFNEVQSRRVICILI